MVHLKTELIKIGEIIFMMFLCTHALLYFPLLSSQVSGRVRMRIRKLMALRHNHGMVTETGESLRFPNPLAIPSCSSFTAPRSNLQLQGMVGHPC